MTEIVFTHGWRSPLYAVAASGGAVETIALRAEDDETYVRSPTFLPSGRHVLLEMRRANGLQIVALELDTGRRIDLLPGNAPRFARGHLLVAQSRTVRAIPFDETTLSVTGSPLQIADGVATEAGGARHYAVSPGGTLAHAPDTGRSALAIADLSGSGERVIDERARLNRPRFAPDGVRLAVALAEGGDDDVWLYATDAPGTGTRLTFDGGTAPIWSPDGSAVAFSGDPFWTARQETGLYTKSADGRTADRRIVAMGEFHRPVAWLGEQQLLLEVTTADGELWIERVSGTERHRLIRGLNACLSPDRQWLAFVSDESGRDTVYVMAMDDSGARWQIAEGSDPVWAPDGRQIFYVSGTRLLVAQLDISAGVRVATQRTVQESFTVPVYGDYDVSPDGRSIALVRPIDLLRAREVIVALDGMAAAGGTPSA